MKKLLSILLCGILMLSGCSQNNVTPPDEDAPPNIQKDNNAESINLLSVIDDIDTAPVISFSTDLFKEAVKMNDLNSSFEQNISVSPLSAYFALSMAANGADGETLEAFEKMFGASLFDINSCCNALYDSLTDVKGQTVLNINNSIWFTDKLGGVYQSYIDRITKGFSAEAFLTDFFKPKEATEKINSWISEKTNKMIPSLFDSEISQDTLAVLVNTLYLKTKWQKPFEGNSTYKDKFTNFDGTTTTTDFMHEYRCKRMYISDDNSQGVVLDYDDGKTAFIAIKPTNNTSVSDFINNLNGKNFKEYINSGSETTINLAMPKFSVDCSLNMNNILKNMGIDVAFDPQKADFSNIGNTSDGNISISDVVQRVRVDIDEEGSEAAAATGIVLTKESAIFPETPVIDLKFDSPFIYAIVDKETSVPLFIGIINYFQ